MRTWQQILNQTWEGVRDEYGNHSQQVVSAFEVLAEIRWFRHVGEGVEAGITVDRASDWTDAIAPLRGNRSYGPNGHLLTASELCVRVIEDERYRDAWRRARKDVGEYFGTSSVIRAHWPEEQQSFVEEYVYEFVSFLLSEIVGADAVGSTYFREMLTWFDAGHFPAGWTGPWPDGRWRIY
jgi:hypothetical protein